ncbi:hypothetical protein IFR04_015902 [Cadophora malorum]|uniref:Bacteriophage T5 Orf172 DNA-binding domain-containing protein n=1 Tax=Cadophora malorum TaxID=108018 RepID=A0A8H7W0U8_9HELO|nr:hypothetical protein IFR04_015902 [Cadophora malorum]
MDKVSSNLPDRNPNSFTPAASRTTRNMSISTSASYFDKPHKTLDTTLSPSPAASPSVYIKSQPQCIHDIGAITAQLLSEDPDTLKRCLGVYKDHRRCHGSFLGESRPKVLAEVERILSGTNLVNAEKCGKIVMRILFCRRHNESEAYKQQLGCFYERYEPWRGDMSPIEMKFLSALRKVFHFASPQIADDNSTPFTSDIPGQSSPRQTPDAGYHGLSSLDSDFNRFEDADEEDGIVVLPTISSNTPVDAGSKCQDYRGKSQPLPEHNTSPSDTNARYDRGHASSGKAIRAIDDPVLNRDRRASPANPSTFLSRLSPKSSAKLRTERARPRNEEAGFDDPPQAAASSGTAQSTNFSFGVSLNKAQSLQYVLPNSSPLTEDFSLLDGDDRDADPFTIEGSPTPLPVSGRRPKKTQPAWKSGNANDNILHTIKKFVAKEGFVYVLRAPQYSAKHFPDELPLVKIGKSMNPKTRLRQIHDDCDISDLERVLDTEDSRSRYFHQIEALVHAELSPYQRIIECKCEHRANHREWFAVPESVALQSVQRWRRFIRQDPYDGRGLLRDVWSEMTDWESSQQESGDEHEDRNRHWNAWLDEGIRRVAVIRQAAASTATDPILPMH